MDKDVNDGTRTGGRIALMLQPNENITITPRVIYQETEIDGFNREDIWNILANPFTTTEPPIAIGERQQYTNFEEQFTDDFLLGDLTMEFDLGGVVLTSISSYTDRDILVVPRRVPADGQHHLRFHRRCGDFRRDPQQFGAERCDRH